VTREQLTVLTGYKRSTRDTYIQRLHSRGAVALAGGRIVATDEGLTSLGDDFAPLPTGDALREHWMQRLPDGERKVLAVLVEAYPKAVERGQLDEATGFKRSSRDTYLQRLSARKLVVSEGRGAVRAAEELFDQMCNICGQDLCARQAPRADGLRDDQARGRRPERPPGGRRRALRLRHRDRA
jgi:hypothetical protein